MFGTIGAVLIVGVNDCFGIAVCIKGVTEFLELVAKFAVVVNLAVENYPGGAVLVVNGLLPTFQVDDRQAAHAQADGAVHVKTIIVWPTMADRSAHPSQQSLVNVRPVVTNYAYNSTHKTFSKSLISKPFLASTHRCLSFGKPYSN